LSNDREGRSRNATGPSTHVQAELAGGGTGSS
jgi:hypothetical protein